MQGIFYARLEYRLELYILLECISKILLTCRDLRIRLYENTDSRRR